MLLYVIKEIVNVSNESRNKWFADLLTLPPSPEDNPVGALKTVSVKI